MAAGVGAQLATPDRRAGAAAIRRLADSSRAAAARMPAMPFLSRFLKRTGEPPEELRAGLVADGIVLIEEHLNASLTFRHYRAQGKRFSFRRRWMGGAVIVTRNRFVICLGRQKYVDVPRLDLTQCLEVGVEEPGVLLVAFDPARFDSKVSGRVEVRLQTPNAAKLRELVTGGRA